MVSKIRRSTIAAYRVGLAAPAALKANDETLNTYADINLVGKLVQRSVATEVRAIHFRE